MPIRLSDHFTYKKLLRFTLPSIVMMAFTSIYGVVDGFFVSNFVGKTPFAAVNFIMPFLMILGTVGFMVGTGGSAIVSHAMGEGDYPKANRIFSLLIYVSIGLGVLIAALGIVFLRPIAVLLGADGQMLEDCVTYGRLILIALPAFILQMAFQSFFVTAEKPQLGLWVTVASGVTNMVLDALLVGIIPLGLSGAALATAISQAVGGFVPILYFARPNSSLLRLSSTKFDGRALLKTCTNGSSELMSNVSMSLVGMLYNIQLYNYAGEDGVAAYGVLMYVNMIFLAAFIGYSIGTAPVIGYHYGADNKAELRGLLRKSYVIIGTDNCLRKPLRVTHHLIHSGQNFALFCARHENSMFRQSRAILLDNLFASSQFCICFTFRQFLSHIEYLTISMLLSHVSYHFFEGVSLIEAYIHTSVQRLVYRNNRYTRFFRPLYHRYHIFVLLEGI
jgi:putative MATE family efflux protein